MTGKTQINKAKTPLIGFISLGCAKNQVDLERLAGKLFGEPFAFTKEPSECDILIINTCGFIKNAVDEAIEAILSMRQQIPEHAKLIVFGCMTERYRLEIAKELPEIDFFAGVGEEAHKEVINYISSLYSEPITLHHGRYLFNAPYYAYLKIAEGCNNRCTYCTIPSIRGCLVSVPATDLLEEAKSLANSGVKEIIIVSQDSSKYGHDRSDGVYLPNLIDLLAHALPDIYFRIMYLNPDGVTEELIDMVGLHKNIWRYFDIPVQHGSDKILTAMNRHSTRTDIERVFAMIRRKLPDAFIRTTVIVGFPGETEADFTEIKEFLEVCTPDFAGFFPYSPEEGTVAAAMGDMVPEKVIKGRLKTLQSIQKKNTLKRLRGCAKGEITCFVERSNDDFDFILEGRAHFQAPEIDGMLYVTDGVATKGYGPYRAKITKVAYPDLYVELIDG
ncbi:MAG: 30S ribosomal protein S12 methylthiotransferase RimO [Deferribacteraceae bacterium]|jgi:ribosomal protein S12 methylthiotransferase|nr:30S ribosomal protein S12 methylthiotransferase RimO [Deferribacteraceae bacterium]